MYVDFTNKTAREHGQLNRKQLATPLMTLQITYTTSTNNADSVIYAAT